ncbi:hypothetical protein FBF34_01820 [Arachnia propionica]|uniref:Relaxase domain-containing protein n=1 Tax=Arachnia propionica TaxID=1750 RepID=A0AB37IBA9_9ACTN|nr:hypothetical protein FBF34_01820 [Arachnia propionica]QUC12749.1 relaxase domain-containing protein [Arachnia propionica]RPA19355.1 hypothetical protein EGT56_06755 [Arachnia propionica]
MWPLATDDATAPARTDRPRPAARSPATGARAPHRTESASCRRRSPERASDQPVADAAGATRTCRPRASVRRPLWDPRPHELLRHPSISTLPGQPQRKSCRRSHKYLLRTVAAGDGDRSLSTPPTRYYAEAGTPPGRWLGSGVTALGNGELTPGARVSETQLQLLVGMGRKPFTGDRRGAPIRVRGAPSALIMSTHRRWRRSPAGHSSRVCSTPLEHAEKIPGGIRQDHPSFLPGLPNVGM